MSDLVPSNLEMLKSKLSSDWKPNHHVYKAMEEYGYYGIDSTRTMASLLNIPHNDFLKLSILDEEMIRRYELGKAKCNLHVGKTMTDVALGMVTCDPSQYKALDFLCTSRFSYDPESAKTRLQELKISLDHKVKLKNIRLRTKYQEEQMELKTTVLAMSMTPGDVEYLKGNTK